MPGSSPAAILKTEKTLGTRLGGNQSRTQSPQAPWPAVWSPGETLGKWNFFNIFDYSGNNEIGEAEVGLMLTLPSIMSRTSQETSAIFQRGQQVTLLVRDWRISIHLLVSAFG